MKTKTVFDRIYKTAMIVVNTIWTIIMSAYCVVTLFQSQYDVERCVLQVAVSAIVLAAVNGLNWLIRRWIKNY